MTHDHSHFQPTLPESNGKPNCRTLIRIEPDGTSLSLVRLHVINPREREEIILIHFLKQYLPLTYKRTCGVNILSRDSPWDFSLEIGGGENFNVEITSIADNKKSFELESAARELSFAQANNQLTLHKIRKLEELFPYTLLSKDENANPETTKNQYFDTPVITVSPLPPPMETYGSLLSTAISTKANKRHDNKAETILVIDDQTTAFTSDEILSNLKNIDIPNIFKEIWIYIGYWGTVSGDGEYTLIKVQTTA